MKAVSLILAGAALATAASTPRPALLKLRGGAAEVEQPKTGKLWKTSTFTREHTRFAWELGGYLGAYVMPGSALDPKTTEAVMVTMNSINTCPYCTGLHGELARMASTIVESRSPAVVYAKTFAEETGRGAKCRAAFETLVKSMGSCKASSVRSLCWALLWGKTTGNSINNVRNKLVGLKWLQISPFDLLMFLYYGPLFLVIGIANVILAVSPKIPGWLSTAIGAFLWVPQALHILPMGILCLALRILAAPFGGLSL